MTTFDNPLRRTVQPPTLAGFALALPLALALALLIVFAGSYHIGKGENGGTGPALITGIGCLAITGILFAWIRPGTPSPAPRSSSACSQSCLSPRSGQARHLCSPLLRSLQPTTRRPVAASAPYKHSRSSPRRSPSLSPSPKVTCSRRQGRRWEWPVTDS